MTKYIIPVLFLFVVATGCNKDSFTDTADQVGTSKVTYFAELTMNGNPYMSLVQGNTFNDPGVTATEKGQSINVTTSGTVNTSQPGLYVITYSAVNKDGFAATTQRNVVVLSAQETPGVDVSGRYAYVGGAYEATITKVAEGVYTTDNIYGSATIPAVFVTLDGATVTIPTQNTAYGPLFGTGTINGTGLLTVTFNLPKYGISNRVRNWQKQ